MKSLKFGLRQIANNSEKKKKFFLPSGNHFLKATVFLIYTIGY